MANTRTNGGGLRFVSWNVKGINGPVKRGRVFSHLKHLKTEIAFLQETHLVNMDHHRLKAPWVGQTFHSNFNSKARGTAILIHKKVKFCPTNVIADQNGRYVIVTGLLNEMAVVLVNLYAPNWDDEAFIGRIITLLPDLNSHRLILGADLNCAICPLLDKSHPKRDNPSKMAKAISSFMSQIGSTDPWRFLHPNDKQFSFYSNVHKSFSRIDYFFVDNYFLSAIENVEYSAIVISDHAPLILDLPLILPQKSRPPWRLDGALLSDVGFCDIISKAIDDFLIINNTENTSPSLLWETLKVVVRGEIISYCARQNKLKRAKQEHLLESIRKLDRLISVATSPELDKERQTLQMNYNLLSTTETEKLLLRQRGLFYEHGEKAGRILSHQIKSQISSQEIKQIRTPLGELATSPEIINDTFKAYYSNLYTSQSPTDDSNMMAFLDSLDFPSVTFSQAEELDQPLTREEIVESISLIQSGKAPGPDGYSIDFYKKFSDKLAPLLLKMFNDSLDRGALPQTLTEASIILLPKQGKDHAECSSYRPISLLNADYKILAKALARRFEPAMPNIISKDQNGFMKNRHSFSNIRRLLNIILSPASTETPEVVVSLDAEKAFDRLEWGYLFEVLKRYHIGSKFISWIKLLYSSPKASVNTNGTRSQYFTLSRGTRQGCNLSPMLFAVAVETLSMALKSAGFTQGIRRGGIDHILSLYADDLLLFISNPATVIPQTVELLNRFGSFSGYKLNLSKSECFPINNLALQIPETSLPFKIAKKSFKYLGVNICSKLSDLYKNNFPPLIDKLKCDLDRWNSLHITLAGRVNCIKMNVLPRFLYLFQSLPVFLPKSFFRMVDKLISSFLWKGKTPRIRKEYLQRHSSEGGLALPDLRIYYWAANIHKMLLWIQEPTLSWCELEINSCPSTSLLALLSGKLPIQSKQFSDNPIVTSTLRIWSQFRVALGLRGMSNHSPIQNNHLFSPPNNDLAFSLWQRVGLVKLGDLYIDNIFCSFSELCVRFNLPRSHLFRYFQVRNFAKLHNTSFPNAIPNSLIDTILDIPINGKGFI